MAETAQEKAAREAHESVNISTVKFTPTRSVELKVDGVAVAFVAGEEVTVPAAHRALYAQMFGE